MIMINFNDQLSAPSPWALICRMLERRLCFSASAADWRRWLEEGSSETDADHAFALLQRAFLQKEEQKTATHVFCPACYCHHEVFIWTAEKMKALRAELYPVDDALPGVVLPKAKRALNDSRITPHSSSPTSMRSVSITASCRCDDDAGCPDLILQPAEIELWILPIPRFARALCRALNLNAQFADLRLVNGSSNASTWQIGSWSTDAVPVILTIQPDTERIVRAIIELTGRFHQRRFILLGPTSRNLDAHCIDLLGRSGSEFFPLEANLVLTHNAILQCTRTPGELFAKFSPAPKEQIDDQMARQLFAMIRSLDAERGMRKAPPSMVLRLYCIEELEANEIARRLKCARSLIYSRLGLLRRKLGRDPAELRRYSTHFEQIEASMSDSRARSGYRGNAAG